MGRRRQVLPDEAHTGYSLIVARALEADGGTLSEVAKRGGLTSSTLHAQAHPNWTGGMPAPRTLEGVSLALGLPLEELRATAFKASMWVATRRLADGITLTTGSLRKLTRAEEDAAVAVGVAAMKADLIRRAGIQDADVGD